MAEKKDKYLEQVEQRKLRQKLNATHILVKCDVKEADIAKYLDTTVREYKKLKEKYPEFNKTTDPTDPSDFVEMVSILQEMAKGYIRTTQRRDYCTNKKGEEQFRKSEVDHFYPSNPIVLIYLLKKFYGTKLAKDFEKLQIARVKLDSKEEWNNESDNDGNTDSETLRE